ncbi:hypothetical protein DFH09DRAFT_328230 [Mycena vulgaris]|nr:hypothetical protein DFH09DRAFT_328230 [Mycena vulgaris]
MLCHPLPHFASYITRPPGLACWRPARLRLPSSRPFVSSTWVSTPIRFIRPHAHYWDLTRPGLPDAASGIKACPSGRVRSPPCAGLSSLSGPFSPLARGFNCPLSSGIVDSARANPFPYQQPQPPSLLLVAHCEASSPFGVKHTISQELRGEEQRERR